MIEARTLLIAATLLAAAMPNRAAAGPVAGGAVSARPGRLDDHDRSPDGVPLRFVLALDGIPYDLLREAQAGGLLTEFRPASRMVSTFPSLSDVAFSAIGGTEPPEGYQIMRFDRETGRVVGNTMRSLGSKEHGHVPADSRAHGSWHRMLGYVFSYRMALGDLREIRQEVLASDKATFVGYLEGTDMLMHVHGHDKGLEFLGRLDTALDDLAAGVRERTGRDLAIDLVSDHGSTMCRGEVVGVERILGRCGFVRSSRLEETDDVAYSLAGIIGSVAITCAPGETRAIASCIVPAEGVDLVAFRQDDAVVVLTRDGEAEIRRGPGDPESWDYRMVIGDPLGLGTLAGVPADAPRPLAVPFRERDVFAATLDGPRPDPLKRLWLAFHGAVKEPSDLLVSLDDGYEAGNRTVRALARMRGRSGTHGSLTRLASLGIITSNWRDVHDVDSWAAHDLLFGAATREAVMGLAATSGSPGP